MLLTLSNDSSIVGGSVVCHCLSMALWAALVILSAVAVLRLLAMILLESVSIDGSGDYCACEFP